MSKLIIFALLINITYCLKLRFRTSFVYRCKLTRATEHSVPRNIPCRGEFKKLNNGQKGLFYKRLIS